MVFVRFSLFVPQANPHFWTYRTTHDVTSASTLSPFRHPPPFQRHISLAEHCLPWRCCPPYRARVCVVPKYWSFPSIIWRIFHSDTFPHIIKSLFLISENNAVHQVSRLVIPGNAGYPGYWCIKTHGIESFMIQRLCNDYPRPADGETVNV
jgi:hypothetical protein